MEVRHLEDWKFRLDSEGEPWRRDFDDRGWEEVIVPHDWAVSFPFSRNYSSGTGYLPGGVGWYRAIFHVASTFHATSTFHTGPAEKGRRVYLHFDGVYKHSQVWCNGYYLGGRASGFCGFHLDITHCLHESGDNIIAIRVDHQDFADSRWYTGSGIVRKVSLIFQDPVYILPDSIIIESGICENNEAVFAVSAEAVNNGDADLVALSADLAVTGPGGGVYTADIGDLAAGQRRSFSLEAKIAGSRLWSPESPALYTLALGLSVPAEGGTKKLHTALPVRAGIRSIHFDPDRGFFLNGESRKIKGVCVHDDAGCLGTAVWPDVWRRRLEKLKAAGCNAIRMSHNPHMDELYDLCDEMGFLVMEEAFDEWEGCKNKWSRGHNVYPPLHQGYYEDFPFWHERDLADTVIRGRNHPSIILWSIGNEIDYPNDPYGHPLFREMAGNNDAGKPKEEMIYNPDKPNMERLGVLAAELAGIVKKYDKSRPVLVAAAFPELSSRIGFFDSLDVAGYNYREQLYREDHRRFPRLPIIGSENGHSLAAWKSVEENPFISGQFLWTGVDYMGEAGGWPVRGSAAGLLDLAGYEKAAWYRRKSIWTGEPFVYLLTRPASVGRAPPGDRCEGLFRSWDYPPGTPVEVICYTNLPGAELFHNNESRGLRECFPGVEYLSWELPFVRGGIRVEAAGASGAARDSLDSSLPGVQIGLSLWQPRIPPLPEEGPGESTYRLCQVEAEILDEAGRLCTGEAPLVSVSLTGPGKILGLENGDLSDCSEYCALRRRACRGKLIIYVLLKKSLLGENREDETILNAEADGFIPACITLRLNS
ncbi:MAG: hypothetical protein LBF74_11525 [Treponema sp.]|jgi:hypothetical protein|nr:hypothetical protein [Treponema sp.]